jgi:hypothetical protein
MTKKMPTDDQLIGELVDSFGHLWECEPPMYSCFCEVKSKVVTAEKILATIEQTIVDLDDLEDLLTEQDLTGSIWTYVLEMRWDGGSKAWKWHYNDTNPDDRQVLLSEIEDKASCLETIFSEFDWYGYLDYEGMKTSDLMAKIPQKYRKFYEPHHKQFLADGEFV